MKDSTRAKVAAIVGAASKQKRISSVYDYQSGGHRNTSVAVKEGRRVDGYDYGSQRHFSGSNSREGSLDFFDYETSTHVQLHLKENDSFDGYDYFSNRHFSGTVRGSSVSIYDYQTSRHYSYSV